MSPSWSYQYGGAYLHKLQGCIACGFQRCWSSYAAALADWLQADLPLIRFGHHYNGGAYLHRIARLHCMRFPTVVALELFCSCTSRHARVCRQVCRFFFDLEARWGAVFCTFAGLGPPSSPAASAAAKVSECAHLRSTAKSHA